MYCYCDTDADCTANVNGHKCTSGVSLCGCTADADCPTPKKCTGVAFGDKYCQ
jgi:hypothetical protein